MGGEERDCTHVTLKAHLSSPLQSHASVAYQKGEEGKNTDDTIYRTSMGWGQHTTPTNIYQMLATSDIKNDDIIPAAFFFAVEGTVMS